MGDHTEVVKVHFRPERISYVTLLHHYWSIHSGKLHGYGGKQYQSLIAAKDEKQLRMAEKVKQELMEIENRLIETVILQSNTYTPAENWHQKYLLRRSSRSWNELLDYYGDESALLRSSLAAKLNALAGGFLTKTELIRLITEDQLFSSEREQLLALVADLKW